MSTSVTVIGNLTRNPQLSRTGDGTPVVNLTLADNSRRLVEGEWVDGPTTFWQVACFGAQAEHVIASLHRGARAIAVGVFRTRTWSGGEDEERSAFDRGRGDRAVAALGHHRGHPRHRGLIPEPREASPGSSHGEAAYGDNDSGWALRDGSTAAGGHGTWSSAWMSAFAARLS